MVKQLFCCYFYKWEAGSWNVISHQITHILGDKLAMFEIILIPSTNKSEILFKEKPNSVVIWIPITCLSECFDSFV